jgi:hypothetical protein
LCRASGWAWVICIPGRPGAFGRWFSSLATYIIFEALWMVCLVNCRNQF